MNGRKHKIVDGVECCNCVNCENTNRAFRAPDSYNIIGHPVYEGICLSHLLEETPMKTVDDYHKKVDPEYNRERNKTRERSGIGRPGCLECRGEGFVNETCGWCVNPNRCRVCNGTNIVCKQCLCVWK